MPLAKVGAPVGCQSLRTGVMRLRTRSEFDRVRREGHAWPHRLVVLVACPNDLTMTRVGLVVGKKIGGAVVRNRARRLMREAVRLRVERIASGWDLVLIARAPIVPVKMQTVADALEVLLRQARLWQGEPIAAGATGS
jgi:ribonuclease P protein component